MPSSKDGKVRLVSRNQNDLTAQYPELHNLPKFIKAKTAILDGEIVALDEEGRSSFSLMQQRTGIRQGGRRTAARRRYSRPLLRLRSALSRWIRPAAGLARGAQRGCWRRSSTPSGPVRYSDHFPQGMALFDAAKQKGWKAFWPSAASSVYEERRSREWLKIKITQTVDCVIGGYTDPEGSRQYFGSIVLGLYDKKGELIHVGQAGTGFDQAMLKDIWQELKKLETKQAPFLRSGCVAKSALGKARTGGRNQVHGMDT